jgi:hypothetical protein
MNAHLAAGLAVLEELCDGLVDLIRPLDPDCLNWSPPAPDTNSIAALVTHTAGSLDSWLARAIGETVQRDRDAEFRARHNADELIAIVERSRAEARRRFALLDGVDLGRTLPVRRLATNQETEVSAAWCVEHALIHAGEHWGQIQLNRQLYAARGERS